MAHASVFSSYRHVNNSGLLESPPLFSTSCFLPINRQILPIQQQHHLSSPNPTVLNKEKQEEEDDDDQQQQQHHYDNDEEEEEGREEELPFNCFLFLHSFVSMLQDRGKWNQKKIVYFTVP
jgi:hypothetical protein